MSKTIEIRDVGPITRLDIALPDAGLCVLRGANGAGKSLALQSVQALVEGAGKVPSRDGTIGAQVSGLGARLTIGRRNTTSGQVEVAHLEGEDPSLLVDPGVKDPAAADVARMKALLRLSGTKVDASAFAPLVGGDAQLREICRPASLEIIGDVPAMAAAIKRDIEGAARKAEQLAENHKSKAAGMRATLEEMGGGPALQLVSGSADQAREAHTAAVRAHSAREAERKQNAQLLRSSVEAQGALATLGEDGTEAAVAQAREFAADAARDVEAQLAEVLRLERELQQARSDVDRAKACADRCDDDVKRQVRAVEQRAAFVRTVEAAAGAVEITDAEIATLAQAVADASAELSRWAVREKTSKARAEAADLEQQGRAAEEAGIELRNAAKGTERVVLEAVKSVCGEDLELHEGRLLVKSDRGPELFSELSHGERWRIALEIATKAVGPGGLLIIRQEGFEALDPDNRCAIAAHAKRLGVVILTAEADAGEIRAETFEPEAVAS